MVLGSRSDLGFSGSEIELTLKKQIGPDGSLRPGEDVLWVGRCCHLVVCMQITNFVLNLKGSVVRIGNKNRRS